MSGISKFFAPYCIKPSYLIESEEKAGNCGFINGLIYSLLLTTTILIGGIKFYLSEIEERKKRWILYGMIVSIILVWILCPLILYYSYKTIWIGYDDAKKELLAQGYSKMETLNILQLFEQKSAPLNVGGIAGGMIFAGGNTKVKSTMPLLNREEK